MTLHIPFLAVALIVVFYVSQPNILMIKLVSVVFVVTVSVALGGVLLIIKWTYDYPLIRLIASVFLFFCAIYLMRVLGKLGMAFFVVALAVIYAQTFPSMTSQSEILVRLLMWLWVAINTAILVTLLVNACFRQAFPGYQFKARLVVMLRQTARLPIPTMGNLLSKRWPNNLTNCSLCISRPRAPRRRLPPARRPGSR
jgi:multidrug resistance protein MdtO